VDERLVTRLFYSAVGRPVSGTPPTKKQGGGLGEDAADRPIRWSEKNFGSQIFSRCTFFGLWFWRYSRWQS